MTTELAQAIKQLDAEANSKDLQAFTTLAQRLEQTMRHANREDYLVFLLHVCNKLSSIDFKNFGQQKRVIRHFGSLADQVTGPLPVEIELELLLHIEHALESTDERETGVERISERKTLAKRWLRALERLDEQIQTDFDPSDMPLLNVLPPTGAGVPAGAAPEAISDGNLRAEYEAAIAKNSQKAQSYARQQQLRELKDRFGPRAEGFIARSYSIPHENINELRQFLNTESKDHLRNTRILTAAEHINVE